MARVGSIYLGRKGKIFGPYSFQEITEMEKTGQIDNYTWICRDLTRGWEPTSSAPPLPTPVPAHTLDLTSGATPAKVDVSELLALCHDKRIIFSGKIKDVSPKGCCFVQTRPLAASMPLVSEGLKVVLSLLNTQSSQTEAVDAWVEGIAQKSGHWEYYLNWNQTPTLCE